MEELEARARLKAMIAFESQPTMTEDELTLLITDYKVADSYCRAPSDAGWVGTWNLAGAAAEAWRQKAGKVAAFYDFGSNVNSFTRSQMHKHMLEQARYYEGLQEPVSVYLGSGPVYDPVIGNLNGGN